MRYILSLSYDGSAFCGWQIQPSSPSVQQCLEEALAKLCGGPVAVTGAGRTDTGVHAADYVCHFDLTGSLPFEASDFCYKLNAILPRSVVVHAVLPAADDFHARFSATQRSYTYFIHRKKDPFVAAYSWQCGFPGLDFDAMNEACQYLLGTHDFSCFEKVGGANKTSLCTITEAFWKPYTPTHVSLMDYDSLLLPESSAMTTGRSEGGVAKRRFRIQYPPPEENRPIGISGFLRTGSCGIWSGRSSGRSSRWGAGSTTPPG